MSGLHIVQVSDPHLSHSHGYFQDNWDAFVECMHADRPDFIFVTGDMCINGPKNPDDLAYARSQLDRLPAPWRAIPGNHDIGDVPPDPRLKGPITATRRARYRRHFGDDFWVEDLAGWRFIGLNAQLMESGLPGEARQATMLDRALDSAGPRSLALFIHKPLFVRRPQETGQSLQALWPKSRHHLLALCERYRIKLVASGHRHCYHRTRHGKTALIWAPSTSFIDTRKKNDGLRLVRRVGYVRYTFDDRQVAHELVEPPLFINHDMRNWMAAYRSTTRLPPRTLSLNRSA